MVFTESAKQLTAEELKEMVEEKYQNPTVERMVFIETRSTENIPGKVFPCYLEAWALEEGKLKFQCCIIQCVNSEFTLLRVVIYEKDFNKKQRIWDKPPTLGLRKDNPFVDGEMQ